MGSCLALSRDESVHDDTPACRGDHRRDASARRAKPQRRSKVSRYQ
jgi:hypothetical protein